MIIRLTKIIPKNKRTWVRDFRLQQGLRTWYDMQEFISVDLQ